MCFVVRKTTSKLECAILTTLYLAGAKNTNKRSTIRLVKFGDENTKLFHAIAKKIQKKLYQSASVTRWISGRGS
jgi:hypothetical protein